MAIIEDPEGPVMCPKVARMIKVAVRTCKSVTVIPLLDKIKELLPLLILKPYRF